MNSRKGLLKLKRHFDGTDSWSMSSSFPQEEGENDFREFAMNIRSNMETNKTEYLNHFLRYNRTNQS